MACDTRYAYVNPGLLVGSTVTLACLEDPSSPCDVVFSRAGCGCNCVDDVQVAGAVVGAQEVTLPSGLQPGDLLCSTGSINALAQDKNGAWQALQRLEGSPGFAVGMHDTGQFTCGFTAHGERVVVDIRLAQGGSPLISTATAEPFHTALVDVVGVRNRALRFVGTGANFTAACWDRDTSRTYTPYRAVSTEPLYSAVSTRLSVTQVNCDTFELNYGVNPPCVGCYGSVSASLSDLRIWQDVNNPHYKRSPGAVSPGMEGTCISGDVGLDSTGPHATVMQPLGLNSDRLVAPIDLRGFMAVSSESFVCDVWEGGRLIASLPSQFNPPMVSYDAYDFDKSTLQTEIIPAGGVINCTTNVVAVANTHAGGVEFELGGGRIPFFIPPTCNITAAPTLSPTLYPTVAPTETTTASPTLVPTGNPTRQPSVAPTNAPSFAPTRNPTQQPSDTPTYAPTYTPTVTQTWEPTYSPSGAPSNSPSVSPTKAPSSSPTVSQTWEPSKSPSPAPTTSPTGAPTWNPAHSRTPTTAPTPLPSFSPSKTPTAMPTETPTAEPSASPHTTQAPTFSIMPTTTSPTPTPTLRRVTPTTVDQGRFFLDSASPVATAVGFGAATLVVMIIVAFLARAIRARRVRLV